MPPLLYLALLDVPRVSDIRIFLSQNAPPLAGCWTFVLGDNVRFTEDPFTPTTLPGIGRFIKAMNAQIERCREARGLNVVFLSSPGQLALTNSVFLLGAYMILELGAAADECAAAFHSLNPNLLSKFEGGLALEHLWRGLRKAHQRGWIVQNTTVDDDASTHHVIPGKLVIQIDSPAPTESKLTAEIEKKLMGPNLVWLRDASLAAQHLVRSHGFEVEEAAAWLLILMRAVVKPQKRVRVNFAAMHRAVRVISDAKKTAIGDAKKTAPEPPRDSPEIMQIKARAEEAIGVARAMWACESITEEEAKDRISKATVEVEQALIGGAKPPPPLIRSQSMPRPPLMRRTNSMPGKGRGVLLGN